MRDRDNTTPRARSAIIASVDLMGKDASARFHFIMERAEEAQEFDG